MTALIVASKLDGLHLFAHLYIAAVTFISCVAILYSRITTYTGRKRYGVVVKLDFLSKTLALRHLFSLSFTQIYHVCKQLS